MWERRKLELGSLYKWFYKINKEQAEAEVVPSSSLVGVVVGFEVGVAVR